MTPNIWYFRLPLNAWLLFRASIGKQNKCSHNDGSFGWNADESGVKSIRLIPLISFVLHFPSSFVSPKAPPPCSGCSTRRVWLMCLSVASGFDQRASTNNGEWVQSARIAAAALTHPLEGLQSVLHDFGNGEITDLQANDKNVLWRFSSDKQK